jgi:cysteine sulfinate desulfinase/cysteine desulfurase-like protein
VATLLGCESSEVAFCSGATESLNWALKGGMQAMHKVRVFGYYTHRHTYIHTHTHTHIHTHTHTLTHT